jgi:plastocyanin
LPTRPTTSGWATPSRSTPTAIPTSATSASRPKTAARPINSAFLPAVQLTTVVDGIFVRGAVAQVQDPPAPAYVVPFGPQAVEGLESLSPDNANGTAIAIAPDGERHVVWSANDGVWYGSGSADGGFSVEQVEATDDIAQAGPLGAPSITLDDAGTPWISYQVVTSSGVEVRVATAGTEAWEVDVAATTELCNGCPSPGTAPIVVSGGAPVVLFADADTGDLSQATLTGSRWQVGSAVPGVEASGLAAASDGETAYLSFYADGSFHVASDAGTQWTSAEVAPADVSAAETPTSGVALDDEGTVYVAWQDADGVHMASGDGEAFEALETRDADSGVMPSIAVTADGATVYLSWYDPEGQDLLLGVLGDVGDLSLANPSPIPPPSEGPAPADDECGADGEIALEITAENIAFSTDCLVAPANEDFTIEYSNLEAVPHNLAVYGEQGGELIVGTEVAAGPLDDPLDVPAQEPGSYFFQCDVHPTTMFGTLAAVEGGGGGGGNGGGGGGGGAGGGAEPTTDPEPTTGAEPTTSPSETAAA